MENTGIIFRVDWLSMTIFLSLEKFQAYWDKFFSEHFGELVDTGRRTAFFKAMFQSLGLVTICALPVTKSKKGEYITFTMKGEACSCVTMDLLTEFLKALVMDTIEFRITRTDLAWDELSFSPGEMAGFVENNLFTHESFRSLAKRESLTIRRDPAKPNDLGGIGTSSMSFGSKSSDRMIRVYDLHGFTRLEFQMRDDRAHLVLLDVLLRKPEERYQTGISHLLDFIDLNWPEWKDFVGNTERSGLKLGNARKITEKRLSSWLGKQVAPALSVMQDVDNTYVLRLLAQGRRRDRKKYSALLEQNKVQ